MTAKWERREISNFDYLMYLNTVAGGSNRLVRILLLFSVSYVFWEMRLHGVSVKHRNKII